MIFIYSLYVFINFYLNIVIDMTDYESLYKQSLVQIQKQKQQIRKLQEEIRQRCQSYLIHSSRYRSKKQNSQKQKGKQNESPQTDENFQLPPILEIQKNTVNLTLQNYKIRSDRIDQQTQTNQQNSISSKRGEQEDKKTASRPIQQNSQQVGKQQRLTKQLSGQKQLQMPLNIQSPYKVKNSFEKSGSISSQVSSASQQSSTNQMASQQKILERQNSHPQVYWQEVVSGLKERISLIQKQKSDLAQKVIDLEQENKTYKRQQKNMLQSSAAMKKKPTKSIQYSNNTENDNKTSDMQIQLNQSTNKIFEKIVEGLQSKINLQNCKNADEKIQEMNSYIKHLEKKLKSYENAKLQKSMSSSQVQQYNYSTPYRKGKNGQVNANSQPRSTYDEEQLQLLRQKCYQLQAQLSTLSRPEKNQQSPYQNYERGENEQQISDPPYLIQEQLQKPVSPYVKRSFVRKKVVKRNLSAMILRTPSKSKQQKKASMIGQLQRLKSHLNKSKNGQNDKQVQSLSRKIKNLQNSIEGVSKPEQKIDEMSDEQSSIARTSGVSQDNFTQIIQVETQGPGFKNYTAHILGLNRKDKSTVQKIKK